MVKKLCCAPCCTRYRLDGHKYCEKHVEQYEEVDRQRHQEYLSHFFNRQHTTSKYSDLYRTKEWKELRKKHLEQFPYCEVCGTKYGLQVHHNYPPGVDYSSPDLFFNPSALQTLCVSCHNKETDRRKK
jgi:5-methylcytosine-specific restriction endonuclease McrA